MTMTNAITMTAAKLPFCGFYCTSLGEEIEQQMRYLISNDQGYEIDGLTIKRDEDDDDDEDPAMLDVGDFLSEGIHYADACSDIARDYADWWADDFAQRFADHFDCEEPDFSAIEFSGLSSPTYYNFSTDRLFVRIPSDALAAVYELCADGFGPWLQERMAPRDGFIPHYSNRIDDWGELDDWDYNQAGLLLEYASDVIGQDCEPSAAFNFLDSCSESVYMAVINNLTDIGRRFADAARAAREEA